MEQNYEVRRNSELGRYAVASRNLKGGDLILEELPFTHGPKVDSPPVCLSCYCPVDGGPNGPRCPKCNWPLCPDCVNNTSNFHAKNECEIFTKNAAIFQNTAENSMDGCIQLHCITPLRVLLAKEANPERWEEEVSIMEDHEAERRDSVVWNADNVNIVQYLHGPCNLKNRFSDDLIQKAIGILEVNSFESKTCEGHPLRCLYPKLAILAHSCVPNTTHSTYPTDDYRVKVRVTVDVFSGDMLYSTYTYTMQGTSARQSHLKYGYHFTCRCARCLDPTELGTNISSLKCNKCDSGFILSTDPLNDAANWKCSDCSFSTTGAAVSKIVTVMQNEIESMKTIDSAPEKVQKYEKLLKEYKWVVHPHHFIQNVLKQGLIEMLGRVEGFELEYMPDVMLEHKSDLCCELLQVLDTIEPGKTRSRAMMLYELHAPLVVLARSQYSSGTLTGEPLKHKLKVAIELLDECVEILEWEDLTSTEGYLAEIARTSSAQLKRSLASI